MSEAAARAPVSIRTSPASRRIHTGTRLLWATPIRRALIVTGAWRVVMAVWSLLAYHVVPPGPYASTSLLRHGWSPTLWNRLVDAGVRYDSFWYAAIAQHGYTYSTHHKSSIAFYPLFPILIKLAMLVVGNVYVAGLLVSSVSLVIAVVILVEWLRDRGLEGHAPLVLATMLCFPFALFYSAMYSESLYLLLVLATFVSYERRRWGLATGSAFLLVLCRPTGIVVLPCLIILLVIRRYRGLRPWLPVVAGLAGLIAFAGYQLVAFGTPLASVRAQLVPPWSRSLRQGLADLTLHPRPGIPASYMMALLAIAVVFVALAPLVYRRFGPAYATFAVLSVVMPAASGLLSMERFVIVDFPVFAALACLRWRLVPAAVTTVGFYGLLLFTALFINGFTII